MLKQFIFATLLLSVGSAAVAGTPRLDRREANQQARIVQGVRSGELTWPEARRLERGEVRLNHQEALAKSDGVVTHAERAHLERKANRMSDRIYVQKHDGQVRY
jgi:hypothetical protein